ncbi:hypothetical protein I7I53_04487 [Histoplasma capsulatum var. duboisii H88]|uniref:Uncharacterized protein n=1 Tax=Ajellomyces capsulatus (strain H88) TaxID=544711 RepID=A0A8A1LQV7_AJEC8|nr:hypothetical protein I7I53_04487 [Histoplasma capsulatum var. duboisii H88]
MPIVATIASCAQFISSIVTYSRLSKVRGLQHQKNVGGKSEACLELFDCLLSRDFVRRSKRQEEVMSFNTRPSVTRSFL